MTEFSVAPRTTAPIFQLLARVLLVCGAVFCLVGAGFAAPDDRTASETATQLSSAEARLPAYRARFERTRPVIAIVGENSGTELSGFAIPYGVLVRSGVAEDHVLPLLLFLDLKMPGTDGFQVLDWIRHQPRLRRLLTVVLSSSTHSRDIDRAYALGAKAYFGKYPVAADVRAVFQLANSMLTIDEIEQQILPGIRPAPAAVEPGAPS